MISVVRDSKSSTKPVKAHYNWLSDGTKIGVRTYDASGNLSGGNEYLGSFIYDRNGNEPVLESVAFSEGMIQVSGGAAQVNYFIRDHLGSPRVVFNKEGTVLSRNDFYPFGQRWETPNPLGKKNRWLYNGKENQSGFGLPYTDYGSRMYDSKLVRWHGVDLLAGKYPGVSPFVYCSNNPILYIDPDGRQKYKFYVSFEMNTGYLGGSLTIGDIGYRGKVGFNGGAKSTISVYVSYDYDTGKFGIGGTYTNSQIERDVNVTAGIYNFENSVEKIDTYDANTSEGVSVENSPRYSENEKVGVAVINTDNEKEVDANIKGGIHALILGVEAKTGINIQKKEELSGDKQTQKKEWIDPRKK